MQAQMLAWGFKMHTFTLVSTGEWSVDDAMWNYFDIPHLNVVHSQADATVLYEDESATTSVLRQRIGMLTFGTVISIFATGTSSLAYTSTVGPYVMVVASEATQLDSTHTEVATTYRVFSPRWATLGFALVQKLLTRNYKVLMSEDLPMRERKGSLRSRGFTFSHDGQPQSFRASRRIARNNVIDPRGMDPIAWIVSTKELLEARNLFVGPDDQRGLRLVTDGVTLTILPRMCRHEGACLDAVTPDRGFLRCPWHGRRESSLANISLTESVGLQKIGPLHTIKIESGEIQLNYLGNQ